MNTDPFDAFGYPRDGKLRCSWCYPREQFTHGEIKREPLTDPLSGRQCMMNVCRKHSAELSTPSPSHSVFDAETLKHATAPAWKDCPPGTIAYGSNGTRWTKQLNGWWQSNNLDSQPAPGASVCLVRLANPAPEYEPEPDADMGRIEHDEHPNG